jgi:RecA/RadA recombinase
LLDISTRLLQVRLVVVDSLAFHFRQDRVFQTESNVKRARLVNTVARELNQLAKTAKVAVSVLREWRLVGDHVCHHQL